MPPQTKPRILLIDDQPEVLVPLVSLLETEHFRVSQAITARSGYQRALAARPDLIILDLHMPDMSGFSVCRLLRESPVTKDVPVLFLSASTSVEERLEGFELGAVDFIAKPFEPREVLARIRVGLHMARLLQAREQQEAEEPQDLSQEDVILRAAISLIEADLVSPPALPELAQAVGTYEKRLSKVFRARLGTTVFAYIRTARMQQARRLLRNDQISIEEVAAQTGFSSASNFSTAFRAVEGISPREYRRINNASLKDAPPSSQ
ncbi:DNA-binding response regulator [Marinobacter fuscus]|uniref:DNA-binding response regulator n=1 Tax=Marinobacter fuscus TaxID=2109942 RepID=A0A2T1K3T9_9GAMM|nr:DNA-binding response regulator [Marinobacter fuscus]PSF04745.1 DNA-binding response regulator [Marinobacter fuscus]